VLVVIAVSQLHGRLPKLRASRHSVESLSPIYSLEFPLKAISIPPSRSHLEASLTTYLISYPGCYTPVEFVFTNRLFRFTSAPNAEMHPPTLMLFLFLTPILASTLDECSNGAKSCGGEWYVNECVNGRIMHTKNCAKGMCSHSLNVCCLIKYVELISTCVSRHVLCSCGWGLRVQGEEKEERRRRRRRDVGKG
jgi:hypothetical protein